MSLRHGKAQIAKMIAAIDADYPSFEDAAKAALAAAEEIFEERASFVVVGQLAGTKERQSIPPDDPEAIKLALGWYSTEGDARSAAESLVHGNATGDSFRVWVLDVHHGTPADLHAKQKAKYAEIEEKRKTKVRTDFQKGIEKRQQEMEERAAGGKGSCQKCGHQPHDHLGWAPRGACGLSECNCKQWSERKRAA